MKRFDVHFEFSCLATLTGTHPLVHRARCEYTHRLLDPKLHSKVLWSSLDEMGVRDSGWMDVNFSSEVLSNYYSSLGKKMHLMDRSDEAPLVTPAEYGHGELFYFTGTFLMQSVELNLGR
jgi:hypothetical protein